MFRRLRLASVRVFTPRVCAVPSRSLATTARVKTDVKPKSKKKTLAAAAPPASPPPPPPSATGTTAADTDSDTTPAATTSAAATSPPPASNGKLVVPPQLHFKKEINGPVGAEPTRFGDWEKSGRCSDF